MTPFATWADSGAPKCINAFVHCRNNSFSLDGFAGVVDDQPKNAVLQRQLGLSCLDKSACFWRQLERGRRWNVWCGEAVTHLNQQNEAAWERNMSQRVATGGAFPDSHRNQIVTVSSKESRRLRRRKT